MKPRGAPSGPAVEIWRLPPALDAADGTPSFPLGGDGMAKQLAAQRSIAPQGLKLREWPG